MIPGLINNRMQMDRWLLNGESAINHKPLHHHPSLRSILGHLRIKISQQQQPLPSIASSVTIPSRRKADDFSVGVGVEDLKGVQWNAIDFALMPLYEHDYLSPGEAPGTIVKI
ncbi:hypothetical protein CEXT_456841 [Caerostris extrusa]|uniref:Uncharacterized protein n=1 Tax=Caerostris extrusa TaxID=172846 RepID=A0AAV4RIW8_CAEEX|nr:hypothetical protein CEXT_456841 [Caerostris extrusa]